jgi:hypothetical protein
MKRLLYEQDRFSWAKAAKTAVLGAIAVALIGGTAAWVTRQSRLAGRVDALERKATELEHMDTILHQRVTREEETRMDEFEKLIGGQLEIWKMEFGRR